MAHPPARSARSANLNLICNSRLISSRVVGSGRSPTGVHAAVRPHVKATVGGTFIDVCIHHGLEVVALPVHVAVCVGAW
jgi:hypothetical protein